ncbi:MAG: cytidine deaminase [Bacteroidaceae bacterium]|nr:cytidine deaminase [Bacteroidaceae bacterium]
MKELTLHIPLRIAQPDELSDQDHQLVEQAKQATNTSYAPYSQFCVGAALKLKNGETICGSNQENAASPVGCCAERTALFYAGAHYPGVGVETIAIAARRQDGDFTTGPISPCGMCRQALMEVEHRFGPIRVLLYGTEGVYCLECIADLLPLVFTSDSL